MDLAAPFGPVTGLTGRSASPICSAWRPRRARPATLESINPGILVENGVIRYQLLPGQLVKIERGEWPFMGGRLILRETILNFSRPTAKRLTFEVVGLDAKTFVDIAGLQGARGDRHVRRRAADDLRRERRADRRRPARFAAGRRHRSPTMAWSTRPNLGMMGNIAFDALRDLRFQIDDHPPRRRPGRRIRDAADDRRGRRSAIDRHAAVHPRRSTACRSSSM